MAAVVISNQPSDPANPDAIQYDDEEKHVLASNDPSYDNINDNNDNDDDEHSPAVIYQNNVDQINSYELFNYDKDKDRDDDDNDRSDNLIPISGLRIHEDAISGITTSPHQAIIASVGDDYRLVLYKINNYHKLQCIRRIKKKYLPVSVSFDNTGDCLAISMIDGVIEIWDVGTMKPIYTLKGHTGSVIKSIWSPSHRNTLASFSNDNTIRIWHPHSMPSTRSSNIIQLNNNICDISWQQTRRRNILLSSVDNKNTLRLYSSHEDYKQIYVGRSMGDAIAFGSQRIITVNGYNLNLFDCVNLNRLNCIKTNKFHSNIINNISLQHLQSSILNTNSSQTDVLLPVNSKSIFATTDKSKDNILCIWQFNDDCTHAKCLSRIVNSHNKTDKKIYSLKQQQQPQQQLPKQQQQQPKPIIDNNTTNLPIPTSFDDTDTDDNDNDQKQAINGYNDNNVISDDESSSEEYDDDYFENFITNLEFCKHNPQYLLSSGKDGTIKLWDSNQCNISNNNNDDDDDDDDDNDINHNDHGDNDTDDDNDHLDDNQLID